MSEFKFKLDEEVQHPRHGRGKVVSQERAYAVEFPHPQGGGTLLEDVLEDSLRPIPSAPLDANGEEIGVGDLVQWDNKSVGRVSKLNSTSQIVALFLRGSKEARDDDLISRYGDPSSCRVLEKAPPRQICLGSRVRVKATGDEFIARIAQFVEGHVRYDKGLAGPGFAEHELELIED